MNNGNFCEPILQYTAKNSNYETSRGYISLSHISSPIEEIIDEYKNGYSDSLETRLKCYKGYQMEKDLMNRIKAVYGSRITTDIEITAFNGLVKGHPDFYFDEFPADCKSVLMDEWLPIEGKLPRRIYWQMQAYMKYDHKSKALVVFESRESGKIVDYWIRENLNIQDQIHEKLNQIMTML